mmetsp:Transcript_13476/g.28252  ORF Transcript_13476/g.28252 Transcript_13476/m.28252 type:complete len:258 (+) Transcript_13476:285-1058(+)
MTESSVPSIRSTWCCVKGCSIIKPPAQLITGSPCSINESIRTEYPSPPSVSGLKRMVAVSTPSTRIPLGWWYNTTDPTVLGGEAAYPLTISFASSTDSGFSSIFPPHVTTWSPVKTTHPLPFPSPSFSGKSSGVFSVNSWTSRSILALANSKTNSLGGAFCDRSPRAFSLMDRTNLEKGTPISPRINFRVKLALPNNIGSGSPKLASGLLLLLLGAATFSLSLPSVAAILLVLLLQKGCSTRLVLLLMLLQYFPMTG